MLRIPNLTLEDHFKLEDFQHDFNYIMDSLISVSKNAKDYGITGLEADDNTDKIQELINEKGNIYFPEGVYTLTKKIDVYSNTAITLHPNAKFIRKHAGSMFQTATTTETTAYNGEKRIRFNGGTYKHDDNESGSNIFSIFHADDVIFNDVNCLNTVGAHAIDICGSNNIKVLHCNFRGYKATSSTPNKEAIQIDAACSKAYPVYSPEVNAYDGTPTCNVIIDGCEFTASSEYPSFPTAIGQHGQHALKGSRYRNIRVVNNILIGDPSYASSYGIRPISWENAVIANNHIENYRCGIFLDVFGIIVDIHGNTIKDDESQFIVAGDEETYFMGCRNVVIANNTINPAVSTTSRPGIWFNASGNLITNAGENTPKHRGFSIVGNTITMPSTSLKSYGIDFDTTEDVIISGNTIINNAKADSIGVSCLDYCANIIIGDNVYKNITEANQHYVKSNTSNIRKKGRTNLWTGKVYASGENITLSDKISNYDAIMVEVEFFGTLSTQIDFSTTITQSIREFNLADSGSSTTTNYLETRLKKVDDTTIQHVGNKTIKSSDSSIIVDDESTYVKAVYGINY